eukprot:5186086-Amphidinium_carterae.1
MRDTCHDELVVLERIVQGCPLTLQLEVQKSSVCLMTLTTKAESQCNRLNNKPPFPKLGNDLFGKTIKARNRPSNHQGTDQAITKEQPKQSPRNEVTILTY